MYAGKIIEKGTAEEIYHHPKHPYTLGLLQSVPRLDEAKRVKLVPIEGQPPDLINLPQGCSFRARCRYAVDQCATDIPSLDIYNVDKHEAACWEALNIEKGKSTARV
jgi:oligopeptide/dipeptide ABC transporter ATP-binding protein